MSEMSQRIYKVEREVKQLQKLLMQVLSKLDNDRLNEGLKVVLETSDEVTEEELFSEAYKLFDIEDETDDDLITNPDNVKPLDWSTYAQNRSR